MKTIAILLVAFVGLTAQAGLIRVDMKSFDADWCSPVANSQTVKAVCYGQVSVDTFEARGFRIERLDGIVELYVDGDFRGVQLMKLKFAVVGPLDAAIAEVGQAQLGIDAAGEVSSLLIVTPRLGKISAAR